MREAIAVTAQVTGLAFVASNDKLEVAPGAQVTADLEEHDVVEVVSLGPARVPQVAQLARIRRVGQEAAAAGRLGIVLETILGRERDLPLAAATAEIVQPLTLDPTLALGQARRQQLGAERAQQPVRGAGLPRHHRQGVSTLRLRPLADHLAGEDEIEAALLHPLPRLADHEGLAVETGIEVGAIAVLGIEDDVLVFFDDIDDVELDSQLLGDPQSVVASRPGLGFVANCVGVPLDTETREEVEPFDVHALVENDLCRQHGVKASGNQGEGFSLSRHGR